ncbi:MAG: T9SS type A sorting domain-containing protein [Bacteroidota bacterium]
MKKLALIFILCLLSTFSEAQYSQWKFHIAFEDATGAKDTIWAIWDTLATSTGVDTIFGEGPVHMDYSKFNVFIGNPNSDTTKVSALDFLGSHQLYVYAINYQYPITISWDSSLLNVSLPPPVGYVNYARIQNDYFFLVNNDNFIQQFNMRLDNHVLAPPYNWGSQTQFPMEFYLIRDPSIGYNDPLLKDKYLQIFPNPFEQSINISSSDEISSIEVFSAIGEQIINKVFLNPIILHNYNLQFGDIQPGVYFIKFTNDKKQLAYEKVIKLH